MNRLTHRNHSGMKPTTASGATVLALAMGLAFGGSVVFADDRVTSVPVRLAFANDVPAERIYESLQRKAASVCRNRSGYPHGKITRERVCRNEFVSDAVFALNREALTALHRQQIGSAAATMALTE
jgi:UrcA family protein